MNPSINTDVLVIGSGLSGATAAITAATLEARESIGTHYLLEDKE